MASTRRTTTKSKLSAPKRKSRKSCKATKRGAKRPSMTEKLFWSLIAKLCWDKTGDDEGVVEPVVAELSEMGVADIRRFDDILAAQLHALDTEAHAREIGDDAYRRRDAGFSVDAFLYARCCIVANGRETYVEVLAHPKEMFKDMEFEAILYIAAQAYKRKTGREFEHVAPIGYETFANKVGWARSPAAAR
jgi:hypothetical protein